MDFSKFESYFPIEVIGEEIGKEKLKRTNITSIHTWWGKRPTVITRLAVYSALTRDQNIEFLKKIVQLEFTSETIAKARLNIRDSVWAWKLHSDYEQGKPFFDQELPPDAPKILDPFAGGGSIPIEASRLGCSVYAGDLSSVSYHILQGLLNYPQKIKDPISVKEDTNGKSKWKGLSNELIHWTKRLEDIVTPKISPLYPSCMLESDSKNIIPIILFWVNFSKCPHCGSMMPNVDNIPLKIRQSKENLIFDTIEGEIIPKISTLSKDESTGRFQIKCISCGHTFERQKIKKFKETNFKLTGFFNKKEQRFFTPSDIIINSYKEASKTVEIELQNILNNQTLAFLNSPIKNSNQNVTISDSYVVKDFFSNRQLFVNIQYLFGIRKIYDEMESLGYDTIEIEAIVTYLGFFLCYLIERNNIGNRWNPNTQSVDSIIIRGSFLPRSAFVELNPIGLSDNWLQKIIPIINSLTTIESDNHVYQGDISKLKFEDNFFDAIVTDPPINNRIPYSSFELFFAGWINGVFKFSKNITEINDDSNFLGEDIQKNFEYFKDKSLVALKELFRVLKPGHRLCLFYSEIQSEAINDYISLCQEAGFELLDIQGIPSAERVTNFSKTPSIFTFLLFFRKPINQHVVKRVANTEKSSTLIQLAKEGKPILYRGLAELIVDNYPSEIIHDLLPKGGKGTIYEQMMEVIAEESDLKLFLERTIGKKEIFTQIKKITSEPISDPTEFLLNYYGLFVPQSSTINFGPGVTLKTVSRVINKIQFSSSCEDIRGGFLAGSSSVESLIKVTVYGWVQLIYGMDINSILMSILANNNPNKNFNISKLSFGEYGILFRDLPDYIVSTPQVELIKEKFGKEHIYLPKNKTTKYYEKLEKFIQIRNIVEHNKNGFFDNTPLSEIKERLCNSLKEVDVLIENLRDENAVIRIAEPILEIRDKWNRITYQLEFDDGIQFEAKFSMKLNLGSKYLFFGSATNPKPVDPFILEVSKMIKIP